MIGKTSRLYVCFKRFPGAPIESDEDDEDDGTNCHVRFAPDTKEDDGEDAVEKEMGGADERKVKKSVTL